jgi:ATP-binding protein involved in chromosome partitioning
MAFFQPPDQDAKYYIFGKGGSEQLASKLGTELIAQFPIFAPKEDDFEPSIYKKGSYLFDKYNELADKVQDSIA